MKRKETRFPNTSSQRSENMSRIRGKHTGPEMKVRKLLHNSGFRYRLHVSSLPGKPDLVFRGRKAVVLVNGCFWHRHDCGLAYVPKTRTEFWSSKFRRNVERDAENMLKLRKEGWRVCTVWECELDNPERVLRRVSKFLEKRKVATT